MILSSEENAKLLQSVRDQFLTAIELKKQFLTGNFVEILVSMADRVAQSLMQGGKLMICGNGGSAADAQHLAAELLVRLRSHKNREAIAAIPLALDTSTLTACANDYGFEHIYARMVQALAKPEDILLGLSTSGKSLNVINALKSARQTGVATLGFLGHEGGSMKDYCDISLIIPSQDPNRIQEVHITAGHILMDLIEDVLIVKKYIHLI